MKPVMMRESGREWDGVTGSDCLRASLASVLELPIDEVPHFLGNPDTARNWPDALQDWLAGRGLTLYSVAPSSDLATTLAYMGQHWGGEFYLLCGRSGEDYGHVVVGCGDAIVHDPDPAVPRGSHGLTGPVPTCGRYVAVIIRKETDYASVLARIPKTVGSLANVARFGQSM